MKEIFLIFFFLLLNSKPNFSISPDGLTLLALKSAIDKSSDASAFSDWNENDSNPCHWSGISCMNISTFPEPRVVGISISEKNLRGYIPSELGSLIFLRRLNLHGNQLYGSIPDQLFNASSLHSLFLYGNNLSGSIPPSICHLPRLQNLDLSENSLSGSISRSLENCRQLQRLILSGNKFSGEIPSGIWSNLENLVQLDLSSNKFTGSIPSDLGDLKSLSGTLNLSFNRFSGEIPKKLGNLPVTVSFDLRNNNLTGEIPQNGTFSNQGPTAFLNNPLLCGFPLQKSCQDSSSFSQSNLGQEHEKNSKKKGLKPGFIILISAVDAFGVALIGIIIVYIYWKRKDSNGCCSCTRKTKLGGGSTQGETLKVKMCSLCVCSCLNGFEGNESEIESEKERDEDGNNGEGNLVAIDKGFSFELDELLRASAYVLGKSGLGIVYKVVLGNGIPVAVRRLGEGGGQRYKEFANEIQAIGKIKHPNIVRLRAYYWASDEKLLICDFISNGNLASALHGRNGQTSMSLSWSTRLKIAKGTARGLAYLHECSPRKFVHGNIKPTNILLDNEFHPYVSDFGLNRLISITGIDPSSFGGLMGGALPYIKSAQTQRSNSYKAPEARLAGNRPTQKWDVYSFGVLLLEIVTGKSPDSSSSLSISSTMASTSTSTVTSLRRELGFDIVKWVRKGFEEEKPLSEMVDPMLLQEVEAKKEVLAAFQLGLACTEVDPELRPRMKFVSDNLDRIG